MYVGQSIHKHTCIPTSARTDGQTPAHASAHAPASAQTGGWANARVNARAHSRARHQKSRVPIRRRGLFFSQRRAADRGPPPSPAGHFCQLHASADTSTYKPACQRRVLDTSRRRGFGTPPPARTPPSRPCARAEAARPLERQRAHVRACERASVRACAPWMTSTVNAGTKHIRHTYWP